MKNNFDSDKSLVLKGIFVAGNDDYMKLLHSNEFILVVEEIASIAGKLSIQLDNQLPRQEENLRDYLSRLLDLCAKFKDKKDGFIEEPFFSIQKEVEEFLRTADVGISHAAILAGVSKILGSISASFNSHFTWICTQRESNFFMSNAFMKEEITKIYPNIKKDLDECMLCILMGRGTGAAAHLMRLLEAAFDELSVHFSSPDIKVRPSWDSKLKKLKEEIDKLPSGTDQDEFYGIHGFLFAVKEAWRNPTMHLDRRYEPEEAEELFVLVCAFLKGLGRKLPHLPIS